jgi:hypothetical protein
LVGALLTASVLLLIFPDPRYRRFPLTLWIIAITVAAALGVGVSGYLVWVHQERHCIRSSSLHPTAGSLLPPHALADCFSRSDWHSLCCTSPNADGNWNGRISTPLILPLLAYSALHPFARIPAHSPDPTCRTSRMLGYHGVCSFSLIRRQSHTSASAAARAAVLSGLVLAGLLCFPWLTAPVGVSEWLLVLGVVRRPVSAGPGRAGRARSPRRAGGPMRGIWRATARGA